MQCDYFDADVCRSCALMGVPYSAQISAKEAHVRELLGAWPELTWHAPFESGESGFRNKAKLVVGGSIEQPTLGILGPGGRGVDLRECGLYEPTLAETFPVLLQFIGRAHLTPFDVVSGRGELKNIIASISPDRDLMVRFVLRSTESLVRIRKHLPWLREELPQIAVATVNLLPERKAVPEGHEEIILTEQEVLPMRLGGVTLYLRPQSFFQTNTAVARGLYAQASEWINGLVHDDEVRGAGTRSRDRGRGSRLSPQEHDDEVRGAGTRSRDRSMTKSEGWKHASTTEDEEITWDLAPGRGSWLSPQEHDDDRPAHVTRSRALTDPASASASGERYMPETRALERSPLQIWDLYCGVGGFALHCGGPGREVLGVEISEQAVRSARLAARKLAQRNFGRQEFPGAASSSPLIGPVRFRTGDANAAARAEGGAPDILIVNPPRRGIGKLAEWIESSGARHLIYSSCNPVTLAKDLAAMPGFQPREVRVFDMFPQTNHTETMVLASRRT